MYQIHMCLEHEENQNGAHEKNCLCFLIVQLILSSNKPSFGGRRIFMPGLVEM